MDGGKLVLATPARIAETTQWVNFAEAGGGTEPLPALLYARWIVSLDKYEREPRRTIIASFVWGALVATFFAAIFNAIDFDCWPRWKTILPSFGALTSVTNEAVEHATA